MRNAAAACLLPLARADVTAMKYELILIRHYSAHHSSPSLGPGAHSVECFGAIIPRRAREGSLNVFGYLGRGRSKEIVEGTQANGHPGTNCGL